MIGQIQGLIQNIQQNRNQIINAGQFQPNQFQIPGQLANRHHGFTHHVQNIANNLLNPQGQFQPLELNSRGQHLPNFPQRINLETLKQHSAGLQSRHEVHLGQQNILNQNRQPQHTLLPNQQIKPIETLTIHPKQNHLTKLPLPLTFYRTNFASTPISHHSHSNSVAYKDRKVAPPILNSLYSFPYTLKGKRSKEKLKTEKKMKCNNHGTYTMCKS